MERADDLGAPRVRSFACEAEFRAFAESFGACLAGGEVLGLVGTLGAGKTVFTQGVARGLGVPLDVRVISPTFVIHRRYRGRRLALEHLDAYRLRSPAELEALGIGEIFDAGGVVVVEWADKVEPVLPPSTIWISFRVTGPESRELAFRLPAGEAGRAALPPRSAERLKDLLG